VIPSGWAQRHERRIPRVERAVCTVAGADQPDKLPATTETFRSAKITPSSLVCPTQDHGTRGTEQVAMMRSYGACSGNPKPPSAQTKVGW